MTTLGREVRLGTASLSGATGALVDVDKLNVKKYASKTGIAMVLTDYLLYVEHNVRKALEICSEATKNSEFKSWWWKARLGKCYFKLGMHFAAAAIFNGEHSRYPLTVAIAFALSGCTVL
jgi:tetratricopeptide repeat protein 8